MIDDSFDEIVDEMFPGLDEDALEDLKENAAEGFTKEKHAFDGTKENYNIPLEEEDANVRGGHVKLSWYVVFVFLAFECLDATAARDVMVKMFDKEIEKITAGIDELIAENAPKV